MYRSLTPEDSRLLLSRPDYLLFRSATSEVRLTQDGWTDLNFHIGRGQFGVYSDVGSVTKLTVERFLGQLGLV